MRQLFYSLGRASLISTLLGLIVLVPNNVWSMGTPPFDAELRSALGATTKASLQLQKCLRTDETVEAAARYRKLKARTPIANKKITATLSFPGRDRRGSRLITVSYTMETNAEGDVGFSIPLSAALEEAEEALRSDRFYRGVKRVRGKVGLSLSSEDTLSRSIRYVPARGFFFKLCRNFGASEVERSPCRPAVSLVEPC